jgi:hypothetical protein
LTLEFLGLMLLASSVYLAGGQRLRCAPSAAGGHDCTFRERRVLGLLPMGQQRFAGVTDALVEGPQGVAQLVLVTSTGPQRVTLVGEERLQGDVARLRAAFAAGETVSLAWSDVLLAAALAAFGLLWLTLMVLIMKEFLGYHTPWWWRVLRRR